MSGNPEKPPIVPDQPTENQELPPPPPGGPDLPPAYSTGAQHQPPPEKDGLPQYHQPPSGPEQQQHTPARVDSGVASAFYRSADQYDGPAPPLPGPRPTQQGQTAGVIPAYNPADPKFAPPPGSHQGTDAHSSAPPHQEAPLAEHDGSRRNFSSILTEFGQKAAGPINAIANKLGSQSFLPTTMDKECYKAGQILRSFCKDGITSDADAVNPGPSDTKGEGAESAASGKQKHHRDRGAIVKIPSKVIAKAQGLAIFTTARVGFNFSGATGSGILISRLPDGSWSPPSGIQVYALGAGFMFGLDIYDCVCVINSKEALSAFMDTRVSLGPDVAVTAGPWGAGGMVDFGSAFQSDDERRAHEAQRAQLKQQQQNDHVHEKPPASGAPDTAAEKDEDRLKPKKGHQRRNSSMVKPVFSYVKSRGFYAGVTVDGTVITERKDANAAFYGQRVSVEQILSGQVPVNGPGWPAGGQPLYEALRIAEAQQALPDANIVPPPPPAGEKPVGQAPVGHQPSAIHQLQSDPQVAAGHPHAPAGGQQHAVDPLQSQNLQSQPPASNATSRPGDELPGYQDDGVQRPVDEKVHYS